MPAVFGPSSLPAVSHVERVRSGSVRFVTDAAVAASLVPHWFDVPDRPVVSVTSFAYEGVDYLAGGGYNVVAVTVEVLHRDPGGSERRAPYGLVMWESEGMPVIAGREGMGHAKLVGDVPLPDDDGQRLRFSCQEGGAELVRATIGDRTPVPEDQLERLRRDASEMWTFGWKYIQGPCGTVDADYPTALLTRHHFAEAGIGVGTVTFCQPDPSAAPLSGRIVAALRRLPVVEERPAFLWSGSMHIDRAATRRLRTANGPDPSRSTRGL
jgi:hypothetical protein